MPDLLNANINNYRLIFVPWNFLLLLIPYFLTYLISLAWGNNNIKPSVRNIILGVFFLLWLLFIPNSAYVIMDIRHIAGFCPESYYYGCLDKIWVVFFFFLYALAGFYGFVLIMKFAVQEFSKIINHNSFRFFPYFIMPLVSLGVLLGLADRLNSWDVLFRPVWVFSQAKHYFTDIGHFGSLVITSIFYMLVYAVGKKIFKFSFK